MQVVGPGSQHAPPPGARDAKHEKVCGRSSKATQGQVQLRLVNASCTRTKEENANLVESRLKGLQTHLCGPAAFRVRTKYQVSLACTRLVCWRQPQYLKRDLLNAGLIAYEGGCQLSGVTLSLILNPGFGYAPREFPAIRVPACICTHGADYLLVPWCFVCVCARARA
jgi:hypothetical protein